MLLNIAKNKPKFPLSFPPLAKELIIKMLAKTSEERIKITDVKEDRWLKELSPIKDTLVQNLSLIPLPNYHDSIPLDFNSYEVVGKANEEEQADDDVFDLSSDESSTESSDKLSNVFLEDLAYKHSIKLIQQELVCNQNNLNKSKIDISDTDLVNKEANIALSLIENRIQTKKRELAYLLNNEKEIQAHISDLDIQLSAYEAPSLIDEMTNSIHQLKKELIDKTTEQSILSLKKEENDKEYSRLNETYQSKESDLLKLNHQLFELKQSFIQTRRESFSLNSEITMQADIIQSKKENHEQLTKALSDDELVIVEEIKSSVITVKNFNSINEDEILEKVAKIEEKLNQRKQDLIEIKLSFDNEKSMIIHEFKKKKDYVLTGNKKSIDSLTKDLKDIMNNQKEKLREDLKKAREAEHLHKMFENELETVQNHAKVRVIQKIREEKEDLLKKLVTAKILRNKQKFRIKESFAQLEEAKDELNMMKINYYYMQEGIEIE